MIKIVSVQSKKEWEQFIDFPWTIYEKDPHWVPPLRIAVRDMLDPKKNPFFEHALLEAWMVVENERVVGRVAGIIDENHNRFHGEKTAFFGFFEVLDKDAVARLLLNTVAKWAKKKGMKIVRGPMNPSTNHECGLLVEGFDDPPTVMMTYNPPYYLKLLEGFGFKKAKDLYAYTVRSGAKISDRIAQHSDRLRKRNGLTFRTVNLKDFDQEIQRILDIYNDAWEKNWGFVPMTKQEFVHMAKDMKAILDPRLLLIAEVHGKPAAFALTLPDVNQAIKKVSDGKLFPTGLAKLLWNLKGPGRKKTITRCRILTLGIKKEFREIGIGPLMYTEYLRRGPMLGYNVGEASWILEDNVAMNRALQQLCGEKTKTYRILDFHLPSTPN